LFFESASCVYHSDDIFCFNVAESGAEVAADSAHEAADDDKYANCNEMTLPRAPAKPLPPVPVKRISTPHTSSQAEPAHAHIGLSVLLF